MKTEKMNEILGEVIHIAAQAELASDEEIKRQAIGDIYDALSVVMPVDHGSAGRESAGRGGTPGTGESAGREGTPGTGEPGTLQGMAKFLKITDRLQLVRFRGPDFVKLVGRTTAHDGQPPHCYEIKVTKLERGGIAEARMDDKALFIISTPISWLNAEKLSISAMHRFEKERLYNNRKKHIQQKKRKQRESAGREGTPGTGEDAGREGTPGTGKEA